MPNPVPITPSNSNSTGQPGTPSNTNVSEVKGQIDPKAGTSPIDPNAPKVEPTVQEVKYTLEQIKTLESKAKQFDITAKEKAELAQAISKMSALASEDPIGFYEKLTGKKGEDLIKDKFTKMIERSVKSPEQQELEDLRAEKARQIALEEETKKTAEEQKQMQAKKQKVIETVKQLDETIRKFNLPPDQYTMDKLLRLWQAGRKTNKGNYTLEQAGAALWNEEVKHTSFIAKTLPSEKLKEIFGNDIIKRLNGEQIEQLKKADKKVIAENKEKAAVIEKKDEPIISEREIRKRNPNLPAGLF